MEPSVRARHIKSTLELIDQLPEREEIRAKIPGEVVQLVEHAFTIDWVPIANDVLVGHAIHGAIGPQRFQDLCRENLLRAFQGPLLGTLVDTALGILGRDVRKVARWVPKGWKLLFNGCGVWTVEEERGPNELEFHLSEMPEICVQDEIWPMSVATSLSAVPETMGMKGRATLEKLDAKSRIAVVRLRWTPPAHP